VKEDTLLYTKDGRYILLTMSYFY